MKHYIAAPKTKSNKRSKSQTFKAAQQTLKAVRSALKGENLNTEETTDDSFYHTKDYNPKVYKDAKHVIFNKNKIKRLMMKKADKNLQFMSYDLGSSLNKYDSLNQPCLTESSNDRSFTKSKKRMKTKRNSSITKMPVQGKFIFDSYREAHQHQVQPRHQVRRHQEAQELVLLAFPEPITVLSL